MNRRRRWWSARNDGYFFISKCRSYRSRYGKDPERFKLVTMTTVHTDSANWWLHFTGPRFWPTWLMFAALWLVTRLPFSWQMTIGSLVGRIAWRLARRRRHIAEVNIRLCFPQLSASNAPHLPKRTSCPLVKAW